MDRTLVKKMTRRARASGAEPRRDKTGRRSGRAGEARRGADRGTPRPANDQLGNEVDMTEMPAMVEANLQHPPEEEMPGINVGMELAGKDGPLPGAEPLVEADVPEEEG